MQLQTAQLFKIACEYDIDIRIYEGYSGRGMYDGECTTGVVVENPMQALGLLAQYLAYENSDTMEQYDLAELSKLKTDSLGLGTILY